MENVRLASNLAISSFLAETTNAPQDATHQDVTLVIKLRKYLVIVGILEFLFLVEWNVLQNHQNVELNARLLQIVITHRGSHILVTLALVPHVARHVKKY